MPLMLSKNPIVMMMMEHCQEFYKDNEDEGGGDLPQDFVQIMKKQVAAMMESINAGGNGSSGSPRAGPLEQLKMPTWKEAQFQ